MSPGETLVLGGSPGPFVPGTPRTPQSARISASVPPPLSAYVGLWTGHSIRQACREAGGAVGVACRVLPRGNPVRVEIAHDGAEVRAELSLGGQRATMVGRVGADGTLVLRGAGGSSSHTITIEEWRTTIYEARIRGTLSYVISAGDEGLGSVTVVSALDGLTLEHVRP
jgi:hypothetical protein